jgi:Flp pilus assembly protein TadD
MKHSFLPFLLIAAFCLVACGQKANNVKDFDFIEINGTVTITGYMGRTKNVVIPRNINKLPVTAIGERAFSGEIFDKVTIPNSVTRIGEDAFRGCTSLTSVTIPYSVTRIGEDAFYGCTNLTSVTFEQSYSLPSGIFPGDLAAKHNARDGGPGTYTRFAGSQVWTGVTAGPYFQNANDAYDRGDYDKAIAEYTQAIRALPNLAILYSHRGDAYDEKGDYDKAIADFTEAIRINPNYANAYYGRGYTYIDKSDYDKAIADLNEAIRLYPNYASAYHERAYAYIEKGDYDKGIADANQAIQLNPNNANTYRVRGNAYMMKGNFTQARADTNKALQLNPNYQKAKDLDAELKNKGY